MKTLFIKLLFIAVVSQILISCNDDEDKAGGTFYFTPKEYRFTKEGGEMVFKLDDKQYKKWFINNILSLPVDKMSKDYIDSFKYPDFANIFSVKGEWFRVFKDKDSNLHVILNENDSGIERELSLRLDEWGEEAPNWAYIHIYQDK